MRLQRGTIREADKSGCPAHECCWRGEASRVGMSAPGRSHAHDKRGHGTPRPATDYPPPTTNSAISNPKSKIHNAFTLVEMLVVLLIVALGFMLVVGVGSTVQEDVRVRETRNTEAVVLAALDAYHNAKKAYPPGGGGPESTVGLLRALRNESACRATLRRLPREAIYQDDAGKEYLVDGFASPLLYDPTGGLGGRRPLLLSKGHDPIDSTDDILSE